jgi:quercetin dioxygenase-like cupin family protein
MLSFGAAGILLVTGVLEVRWARAEDHREEAYPIPGRVEGTSAFGREGEARLRANKTYPGWFRGSRGDGFADERSRYHYTQLVGPSDALLSANRVNFGTLVLKPKTTYPAHNHPAAEIYYILEGEADWYVDDERCQVGPGSIIYHRPSAVHGWTTTSEKPLKAVWMWWAEGEGTPDELSKGARLTNPDLAKEEKTARPDAVPLPKVRK